MSCGNCEPGTVRWVAHGVAGLTQAVLGIDRAPEEVVMARRLTCRNCPHSTKHPTKKTSEGLPLVSLCDLCFCLIRGKTANAAERCPDNRWHPVAPVK